MDGKQQPEAAILVACLVLCASSIVSSGHAATSGDAAGGGCALSTIVVTQTGTHVWAHGQPVHAATVRNACRGCAQSNVKVACNGFDDTTLAVDPKKLRQVGGGACLVNGGTPVAPGQGVTFRYAASRQVAFRPVSATVAC